jgi:very-short-patch-repair endonuclease
LLPKIDIKLDYWKNRLLDLGKRSNLINCPLPKDGNRVQRHTLLIKLPASDEIWSMIADDNGSLSFPVPVNGDESESNASHILSDAGIETNQAPNETYKTLRNLMKKSKEFAEEKGLNALHLAFGFINWRENGAEGQEMRSPLLLVPVNLTQDDIFSPIVLSRSDEEISSNHSLEQKLLNDFGVELPDFTEDTEWFEYIDAVSAMVASIGWNVSADSVQLSLFSFMKINMYRDLERNTEKIKRHHIIRAINGEVMLDGTHVADISSYEHDKTEPQDVFSVVDADSSQQDAILLAKRGASFVLQGPPGTGKSQTITNIIAELIASGKKVLFVSEKVAALEVVYKRLTKVGLGDFCLTLHSHKAKRKEVLEQFDKSIKLSRQRIDLQQGTYDLLYKLKETRDFLTQYCIELHTVVQPLGKTIYQAIGYLSQYERFRNIDYIQKEADKFSYGLLSQCESALEEVTRVVSKSGYQVNNPWNGCVLTQPPTFEFRQRFIVDADVLLKQIAEGLPIFSQTGKILGVNLNWGMSKIDEIQRIYDCATKTPVVSPAWIALSIGDADIILDKCVAAKNTKDAALADLDSFNVESDTLLRNINNGELTNSRINIISVNIKQYNYALESLENITEQNKNAIDNNNEAELKYASSQEKCDLAVKLCDDMKQVWQLANNNLLTDYDENILSLNTPDMLLRYRTRYRSPIKRIGGTYRKDRRAILACCKKAAKLTYEQGLVLLDRVNDVSRKKSEYEQHLERANEAEALLNNSKDELDRTSNVLCETTNNLESTNSMFLSAKNSLIEELSKAKSHYSNELNKKSDIMKAQFSELSGLLGIEIDENSDFIKLKSKLEWCSEFKNIVNKYSLGNDFAAAVCNGISDIRDELYDNILLLRKWQDNVMPEYEKFTRLFDEDTQKKLQHIDLISLSEMVKACADSFASLEFLIDYRIAEKRLTDLGINDFLTKAKEIDLDANEIIPVFRKCFFRSWLDAIIPKYPTIQNFRRLRQDEQVAMFGELDKSHLEISKAIVVSNLVKQLPNFDAFSSNGEIALLRREMAKQRRLMPTRLLIAALPNLLPTLKPCVMMSPLSVSTYLGNSDFEFDVVIFDEASQVRTEDAIGAIFRARQTIIAGDSKQLPPSDFFTSSMSSADEYEEDEDGEVNDAGAYESLLDEASMLPSQSLLWHYRSRHEHLIAFSNAKIYQGSLTTFPSSVEKIAGMGVEYIYVKGGVYDRGGKNGNKAEAKRVAELVFEHFQTYPGRSIGIIAFGEVQQSAIQDALIEKRRNNPTFEHFFKEDNEEALFIKNLETVQGDERDTIIFSIGYAHDSTGKFIMNFGPLSRAGGERRLNVAVTRARFNLKLVGSIIPTDIDTERTSGQGPRLLRLYIDFAINGIKAILGEISTEAGLWFDSSFEMSVHKFLTENGFDVATQVGCSGYRIDMAVKHPKYQGRYAIGIECDGAMYHSARTARERDRLRQTVLEDMGWKIYRVWSTDWIKDCQSEGNRLLKAVKDAIANYREIIPSSNNSTVRMTDFISVNTKTEQESKQEGIQSRANAQRSRYYGAQTKDVPLYDIVDTMRRVLSITYGLKKEGLFKDTALYGYGWERQGNLIKQNFELAFNKLISQGVIVEESDGKLRITTKT